MLHHRTTRCNKRQQQRPYDRVGGSAITCSRGPDSTNQTAPVRSRPSLCDPVAPAPAFLLHVGKSLLLTIIILASFSSMPRALRALPISILPLPLPPVIIAAAAPFPPAIAFIVALIIVH